MEEEDINELGGEDTEHAKNKISTIRNGFMGEKVLEFPLDHEVIKRKFTWNMTEDINTIRNSKKPKKSSTNAVKQCSI
jgi:hypothetical protein